MLSLVYGIFLRSPCSPHVTAAAAIRLVRIALTRRATATVRDRQQRRRYLALVLRIGEKKGACVACSAFRASARAHKPWIEVATSKFWRVDFLQAARSSGMESGGMGLLDVPTPVALLGGLMLMALSAHYMTARSKTG